MSAPIIQVLQIDWVPDVVVSDGMFLIQCNPLRQTMTIMEYGILILNRFVIPQYKAGTKEVHIVFDIPSERYFNPKSYEHNRRDKYAIITIMSI